VTGAFSQMIGALTYGASATDLLLLLQGAEPSTPVGSQAANPSACAQSPPMELRQ
jgi:hypothetical protein